MSLICQPTSEDMKLYIIISTRGQSSGAVWKSRWTSWAPVPNKPTVSVDVKQHSTNQYRRTKRAGASDSSQENWLPPLHPLPLPPPASPPPLHCCCVTQVHALGTETDNTSPAALFNAMNSFSLKPSIKLRECPVSACGTDTHSVCSSSGKWQNCSHFGNTVVKHCC